MVLFWFIISFSNDIMILMAVDASATEFRIFCYYALATEGRITHAGFLFPQPNEYEEKAIALERSNRNYTKLLEVKRKFP